MADYGGWWLRQSDSDECVVFIHGIMSDGESAWTNGNGNSWPMLLKKDLDFTAYGIYIFSYRSDVFCRTYSLKDVVDSLRESFNFDGLWNKRHIVFVCHSMGGIVARRFLCINQTRFIEQRNEIGLFLVASPSLGSRDANELFPFFFARVTDNSQAAALQFSQNNVWLNDLHDEFRTLKESGRLRIKGKELVEDQAIIIKKLFGFSRQVVEPWSAATYFGESFKIPGSDHSSIAKPKDETEPQYKALAFFLKEMRPKPSNDNPRPITEQDRTEAARAIHSLNQKIEQGEPLSRQALLAFNEALMETRRYVTQQKNGAPRSDVTENRLSGLWMDAAQQLYPQHQELAQLCMIKGNGWVDETVWDDPRYKNLPIKLNDMLAKMMEVGGLEARDILEGDCEVDTVTWGNTVMLSPFTAPPEISLSRPDGRGLNLPAIIAVTPDQFQIKIQSSDQAGKWHWRARGTLLRQSTMETGAR